MVVAASGPLQAEPQVATPYRTVGQWKVETVMVDGKLFGCRAGSASIGDVQLLQYANGNWAMSLDMDIPPGSKHQGMLELNRASVLITITGASVGKRQSFLIKAAVPDAFLAGGNVSLDIAGKSLFWRMTAPWPRPGPCRTAARPR